MYNPLNFRGQSLKSLLSVLTGRDFISYSPNGLFIPFKRLIVAILPIPGNH